MKLVMTLVARNEADILDAQLRYHLEQGVDFFVATDHRSVDGTTDILDGYAREGHLHLIREDDSRFLQSEWVTRMARMAATDFEADWVINGDADEFWWPRRGPLKDVLDAVPARFGVVRALWRNFVLRPEQHDWFHENMTVRTRPSLDPSDPYHVQVKVAHRADPNVAVTRGNHDAYGERLLLLRDWFPFEVLHFPIRTRAQLLAKYADPEAYRAGEYPKIPRHIEVMASKVRADEQETYNAALVDDAKLDPGLADGTFTIDTRLRDVLRSGKPTPNPKASLADDAWIAEEVDLAMATDAAQRLPARCDDLDRRLERMERGQTAP
jgi:Glycosyl transferase family 2